MVFGADILNPINLSSLCQKQKIKVKMKTTDNISFTVARLKWAYKSLSTQPPEQKDSQKGNGQLANSTDYFEL